MVALSVHKANVPATAKLPASCRYGSPLRACSEQGSSKATITDSPQFPTLLAGAS